jgi:hypothetical protein
MAQKRNTKKILVEKPERKMPLGIHRHICGNNIKIELEEIWRFGVDWIHLAQDRQGWQNIVNTTANV